jgi:hypothetical protein
MRHLPDENALEAPVMEGGRAYYIRSLSDPRALIHGNTGEVFMRADGLRWEHPAYHVARDRSGLVSREIASAYADSARYPTVPTTRGVAA